MISPLLRRAPRRHLADRVWLSLLVLTFALVSAAAAGAPLLAESAQNAAVARVLGAAEDAATVRQQPVVRVTGGRDAPVAGSAPRDALAAVPGLGPPTTLGVSFGDELAPVSALWRSVVEPVAGAAAPLERRLAAVDDPVGVLAAPGGTAPPGVEVAAGGVWLDEAAATALDAGPGDEVRVRVSTRDREGEVVLPVAGVYALDASGLRPADRAEAVFWRDLADRLPQSTGFGQVQPPLVTEVDTLDAVADELGEEVLWSLGAGLDPAVPTLRGLVATGAAVEGLPRELPPLVDVEGPRGRYIVAGGVPDLQEQASGIASAAVGRTRGVAWSALALAGLAVLVVTVLGDARRRHERRLEAAIGLHPVQVGALRVLEAVPAALTGGVLGALVAWAVVAVWGPGGSLTAFGLGAAALDAATVVGAALLLVGSASAVAARATGRLTVASGPAPAPTRGLPWRSALLAGAATTVAGVLTGSGSGGGLEVVAPLLVSASCGAVVAGAARAVLRRRLAEHSPVPAAGGAGPPGPAPAGLSPQRAARLLAARRLATVGGGQDAVVVLLTAGLAMAGFVALADRSLVASVESKSAVLAGAASVVELPDGEALALAPEAPARPELGAGFPYDLQGRPVDLDLRPPPDIAVPTGDTVVWVDQVAVDGAQQVPLRILDTTTAGAALDFGQGSGALTEAREALTTLTEAAGSRGPRDGEDPYPPVVLVGEPRGLAVGDVVEVRGTFSLVGVEVVATAPVFPGQGAISSLLVADTDTYLAALQLDDPRFAPEVSRGPLTLQAEYWSSRSASEVAATVSAAGLPVDEVVTAATQRLQPSFVAAELVQDYQLAVAVLLVVVALVGTAVRADRAADRALPAAAVLRRTALGRRGVARSLVLEQLGVVATSVVAAAVALALLVPLAPPLLDPAPRLLPGLEVGVRPPLLGLVVVLVVAAVPLGLASAAAVARIRGAREEVVLREDR